MDSPPFVIQSKVHSNMSVDESSPRLTGVKSKIREDSNDQQQDSSMEIATPNKRALMTIGVNNYHNVFNTSSGSITGLLSSTPLSGNNRMYRQASMDCSFSSPVHPSVRSQQDVPMMSPHTSAPLSPHQRSYSETDVAIMNAVFKADQEPDLIGDFTKAHALPLMNGKHQDLKSITPETLVDLMDGHYSDHIGAYAIVDCRYPYEYEGGHIEGAVNIFSTEALIEKFFSENLNISHLIVPPASKASQSGIEVSGYKRTALIFHCEFSSKRGPKLYRLLRSRDREANQTCYPKLNYPEIYILDGGYKAFYEKFQDRCVPKTYTPMDTDVKACRHFQAKSKSWDPRYTRGVGGGENLATTANGMGYRVIAKRPSLKPRNFN